MGGRRFGAATSKPKSVPQQESPAKSMLRFGSNPALKETLDKNSSAYRTLSVIAEQVGLAVEEVTEEKSLANDLGMDDLDIAEMIESLSEKFSIAITDDQAERLQSVNDVLEFVEKQTH